MQFYLENLSFFFVFTFNYHIKTAFLCGIYEYLITFVCT